VEQGLPAFIQRINTLPPILIFRPAKAIRKANLDYMAPITPLPSVLEKNLYGNGTGFYRLDAIHVTGTMVSKQ